jgi:hypothetical protein
MSTTELERVRLLKARAQRLEDLLARGEVMVDNVRGLLAQSCEEVLSGDPAAVRAKLDHATIAHIAVACLNTGAVPAGVKGIKEAVDAVCKALEVAREDSAILDAVERGELDTERMVRYKATLDERLLRRAQDMVDAVLAVPDGFHKLCKARWATETCRGLQEVSIELLPDKRKAVHLSFEDDRWQCVDHGWMRIPLDVFDGGASAVKAWVEYVWNEHTAKAEREHQAHLERVRVAAEKQEREEYERLKRKFG